MYLCFSLALFARVRSLEIKVNVIFILKISFGKVKVKMVCIPKN